MMPIASSSARRTPPRSPYTCWASPTTPSIGNPYQLFQREIVMRIERLDGVASVEMNGLEEPEIYIELDRARTESAGLNIYQIAQELGADNFTMASGDVRWGGRKFLLRSVARFADLEDIRNRRLSPHVRLGDVADVEFKPPKQKYRVRANSNPAVAMMILKEGQANTLDVARRIQDEVEKMQGKPRLQNVGMVPLFDQGQVIRESLQHPDRRRQDRWAVRCTGALFLPPPPAHDPDHRPVHPTLPARRSDDHVLRRGKPQHPLAARPDDLGGAARRQLGGGRREHPPAPPRRHAAAQGRHPRRRRDRPRRHHRNPDHRRSSSCRFRWSRVRLSSS